MSQVVIYSPTTGGLAVIHPATNNGLTIQQIAVKDVPTGLPFKIIEASTLPTDRTFREAWEWDGDLSTDNDGVGG